MWVYAYVFYVLYQFTIGGIGFLWLKRGKTMVQCPNCGGVLKFDIATQQMRCASCASLFNPYAFGMSGAEEETEYDVTVFRCPQCGGEITSTDETAAGFCSYCGSPNVLESRVSREKRPQYIIPFKKTKQECVNLFEKFIKKSVFAPKSYRQAGRADSFRGIYMPYWMYDMSQVGPVSIATSKSHRSGDYIITDHYRMTGDMNNHYNGVSYDASSSFADDISSQIAPYEVKDVTAFSPSFLSGYYADIADVPAGIYDSAAKDIAKEGTYNYLRNYSPMKSQHFDDSKEKIKKRLNTKIDATHSAMLPVWFMSYRNRDRVAYATVNGQTGKVKADVPVSIPKYFLCAAVLAVGIFLILNMIFTVTPDILAVFVALLALISALMYSAEMKKIVAKENYDDDEGMLSKIEEKRKARLAAQKNVSDERERLKEAYKNDLNGQRRAEKALSKEKKEQRKEKNIAVWIIGLVVFLMFAPGLLTGIVSVLFLGLNAPLICGVISAVLFIIAFFSVKKARENISLMQAPKKFPASVFSMAAILVIVIISFWDPASDYIYYGAVILAMVGIIANIVDMILSYNYIAMRPLPQFEMYKGGDDRGV